MSILGNWKVILEHREKIGQTHSKGRRDESETSCGVSSPCCFVTGVGEEWGVGGVLLPIGGG